MKLHITEWGFGPKTALLIHGIIADARTWQRVAPAIAERGYRVIAPDLRGHGQSPRGAYSIESWADDVVESVPPNPDLAIGHSLGGVIVSAAVERLRPKRAVYVDPAWRPRPSGVEGLLPRGVQMRLRGRSFAALKGQTRDQIRREHLPWADEAIDTELDARRLWDTATIAAAPRLGVDLSPREPLVPSLIVVADPSDLVPPRFAAELHSRGFEVRSVPKASHCVHLDDLEGFMRSLEGWL